jgi:hypothetical protein
MKNGRRRKQVGEKETDGKREGTDQVGVRKVDEKSQGERRERRTFAADS